MFHFRIGHVLGCQYGLHAQLGASIDCLAYVVLKVEGIRAELVCRRCGATQSLDDFAQYASIVPIGLQIKI